MTRDEQNRKIAEWLAPNGQYGEGDDLASIPDFFTDESASALVLEKIRSLKLKCGVVNLSQAYYGSILLPDFDGAEHGMDRKTGVALAALKLIEQETK